MTPQDVAAAIQEAGEGRRHVLTVAGGPLREVVAVMGQMQPLLDRLYPGAVMRNSSAGFEIWGKVDQDALDAWENGDEPDDDEEDG